MNAFTKAKKNANRKIRGQGMTEYIIIVALIAIAAIGVITLFGDNIRALFSTSATALAGSTSASTDSNESKGVKKGNLKTFGEKNAASDN